MGLDLSETEKAFEQKNVLYLLNLLWVHCKGIILVGMHKAKSVINGTEQRWASGTKVNEYMEFIELRASKLGVAHTVRADFEICSVLVEMTRCPNTLLR